MPIVVFSGLLVLIVGAAWLLSEGAEILAEKYGANFAGSILLALVTTLPEYLFVFWAAQKGDYNMAMGSAIGACTLLVTLGYGSVILVSTTRLSKKPVEAVHLSRNTQIDAVYLLLTAVLALILARIGDGLNLLDGIILAAVFAVYVLQHWRTAAQHASTVQHSVTKKDMKKAILMLVGGAVVVVAASEPFVESMIEIAHMIGVSPMAVAIILSPIASELPEKVTAYMTVIKNGSNAEISICNFIGSKINHNSLLLTVLIAVAVTHGTSNVPGVVTSPFIIMTVLTVVAAASLATRRLDRWHGWMFLSLYALIIVGAYSVR